ncbi:hypothetical protein BDV09DRAFT_164800 [Aspergillus tetrazonus]
MRSWRWIHERLFDFLTFQFLVLIFTRQLPRILSCLGHPLETTLHMCTAMPHCFMSSSCSISGLEALGGTFLGT